ncbi:MAG TPA: hypothetical protein VE570_15935 [Thermoleophilaceae bacterium]|nr:hypothetical protein [Thermoleophilaceae bacterium]
MSLTSADGIERSVHKTNEWLKDLASEPSWTEQGTPRAQPKG